MTALQSERKYTLCGGGPPKEERRGATQVTSISAARPGLKAAVTGSGAAQLRGWACHLAALGSQSQAEQLQAAGSRGLLEGRVEEDAPPPPPSTPVSDGPRNTHVWSTPHVAQPKENLMNWTGPWEREFAVQTQPSKSTC